MQELLHGCLDRTQGETSLLKNSEVFAIHWYKLTPLLGSTGLANIALCVLIASVDVRSWQVFTQAETAEFLRYVPLILFKIERIFCRQLGHSALHWKPKTFISGLKVSSWKPEEISLVLVNSTVKSPMLNTCLKPYSKKVRWTFFCFGWLPSKGKTP